MKEHLKRAAEELEQAATEFFDKYGTPEYRPFRLVLAALRAAVVLAYESEIDCTPICTKEHEPKEPRPIQVGDVVMVRDCEEMQRQDQAGLSFTVSTIDKHGTCHGGRFAFHKEWLVRMVPESEVK